MISHCHLLTDKSLEYVKKFKRLRQLKLKSGLRFSENGMLNLMKSLKNLFGDGLSKLHLGDNPCVSDDCLSKISER